MTLTRSLTRHPVRTLTGLTGLVGLVDGGDYGDEALALIDAMSAQPSETRQALIDSTIAALKTADLWDDLDVLYILAAHDAQAARLNWKAPGSYAATVIGSPTFTADQGYTGDASTGALDTGWTPSTNGVTFTQDAAHVSAWTRTSRTADALYAMFGARRVAATANTELLPHLTAGVAFGRVNCAANGVAPPANIQGFWVVDRPDATGIGIYVNDVALTAPAADTSVGLPDRSMYLLATNGGSVTRPSGDQISIFTAGAALGATKRTALYTILQTYLTAIGAV